MAAPTDFYGHRRGKRQLLVYPVDSTSADIAANDMLTFATDGYVKQAAAGDTVIGFAAEGCTSPSTDGGVSIKVDVSEASIYEFPPDVGTVTQALLLKTCDAGGPRSIDIDASTDNCLRIVEVDTDANTVSVQLVQTTAGV